MTKVTLLSRALVIALVFCVAEVIGGLLSGSLSILADAVHLLLDATGFGIALVAAASAKAKPTAAFSFGFGRAEVLGALLSVISLWALSALLVVEAYARCVAWWMGEMSDINGRLMFFVACLGVLVNVVLAVLFHAHGDEGHSEGGLFHSHEHAHGACDSHGGHSNGAAAEPSTPLLMMEHEHASGGYGSVGDIEGCCNGHDDHGDHDHSHGHTSHTIEDHAHSDHAHGDHAHEDLAHSGGSDVNVDAAYLHVLTDLAQSVLVALCGLAIWIWPAAKICDPACTLVFAILVVFSTLPIFNRVMTILLEGTPSAVDPCKVEARLRRIPGVMDVHDLHVWNLSSNSTALTCHMIAEDPDRAFKEAKTICKKLGVHATIQIQRIHNGQLSAAMELCCGGECAFHTAAV